MIFLVRIGDGIVFNRVRNGLIEGCSAYGHKKWTGIDVSNCYNCSAVNNFSFKNTHGIVAESWEIDANRYEDEYRVLIKNNHCRDNEVYGIFVKESNTSLGHPYEIIVNNNTIKGGGTGIRVLGGEVIIIDTNLIFQPNSKGIFVDDSPYCMIKGNFICSADYGIHLGSGSDYTFVTHNYLKGIRKQTILNQSNNSLIKENPSFK